MGFAAGCPFPADPAISEGVGRAEFGYIPHRDATGFHLMNRILLSTAVFGLMAGVALGADLKSGPQAGDSVSVFNPLNVTGKSAGQKACPI